MLAERGEFRDDWRRRRGAAVRGDARGTRRPCSRQITGPGDARLHPGDRGSNGTYRRRDRGARISGRAEAGLMRKARSASFDRRTTETRIAGKLVIDGAGKYDISSGIRFFDHMLELFTRHGGFDLKLHATGDLDVDQHHTVEDVGIVLGEAVSR